VQAITREWLEGLRSFVAEHRQRKPLATRDSGDAAWHAERSILGASLVARLAEIEQIRTARRSLPGVDPDPALVVTTSAVGIEAVQSLRGSSAELAALAGDALEPVTELEYRLWCIRHPDEGHRMHVNLWSWVKTRVPEQRHGEFARHPLAAGEHYWLHREGLAGAGSLDRRACHLWKWNGRHAALLEAFVAERGV
jgi:hypothetical protein